MSKEKKEKEEKRKAKPLPLSFPEGEHSLAPSEPRSLSHDP